MSRDKRVFTKARQGWGPIHATVEGTIHDTLCGYSLKHPVAVELYADTSTYQWGGHPCWECRRLGGFATVTVWAERP